MKQFFNRIFLDKGLSQNILKLLTGTGLAQLIAVLSIPILTRIYSPADFGALGIYMAASMIMAVLITGRYDSAIPIPALDEDAWSLLLLTMSLSSLIMISMYGVLLIWQPPFLKLLHYWLWFIPIGVLVVVCVTTTEYWLNRKNYFGWVAKTRLAGALIIFSIQLIFGKVSLKTFGLIGGFFIGTAFTAILNIYKSWKIRPRKTVNILGVAKQYIRFPQYLLVGQLFNTASNQLPTLVLGSFFNATITGWYTMGNRGLAMLDLIATAVGQVFYPEAARRYAANGECKELYNKTVKNLFYLTLIFFPVLFIVLPDLFGWFLGKQWRIAGELTRWLFPMFFMRFIFSPMSTMFFISGKQNFYLYRQMFLIGLVLLSMFIGVKNANYTLTIALFSFTYVVAYTIDGYISYRLANGENI